MISNKLNLILTTCLLLLLSACGLKEGPQPLLDTPGRHVTNGVRLLKAGKIDPANYEFGRAKELSPSFSPAYVGIGLVYGFKNDFKNGFEAMNKAERLAQGKAQKIAVQVGMMRLYMMGRDRVDQDWLKRVEIYFDQAVAFAPDFPEPYYYMGIAYKIANEFQKAAKQFVKVIDLDKAYAEEADNEYSTIRWIEAISP